MNILYTFFWTIIFLYDLSASMLKASSIKLTAWGAVLIVLSWHIFPSAGYCYAQKTRNKKIQTEQITEEKTAKDISVVVYSQKDGISDEITDDVSAALRYVLPQLGPIKIVPPELVERILTYYNNEEDYFTSQRKIAIDNLTLAKKHYFGFQYDESKAEVAMAIDILEQGNISENGAFLHDAYLSQGVIIKGAGNKKASRPSFEKAVAINPFYQIDRTQFAPSVVVMYRNEQKDLLRKGAGKIIIKTEPAAAEVYVNGNLLGVSPLDLPEVPFGEYQVLIKTNKYEPIDINVDVINSDPIVINEKLKWIKENKGKELEMNVKDVKKEISKGVLISDLIKSDKTILINCDEKGSNNILMARMVDRKYRSAYRSVIYKYKNIEERAEAIAAIATILLTQAQANLMDDPLKYLDPDGLGDPILLNGRKGKIYMLPAFWAIVGAITAGAIAGGVAASLSGGDAPSTGSVNVRFK